MMKETIVVSLFVWMIATVFNTAAIAQIMPDVPTPPPASSGKNEQAKKASRLVGGKKSENKKKIRLALLLLP